MTLGVQLLVDEFGACYNTYWSTSYQASEHTKVPLHVYVYAFTCRLPGSGRRASFIIVGLLAFKVQGSICMHMQIRIAAREMGYI